MKKILLCGASEFLIANLIRYMSYRTKDYEFVSIDNLKVKENYKLIYVNRNHKFYVGDTTDKYFMDRLIFIEKPDIIVNGINNEYAALLENPMALEEYKTHLGSVVLENYKIPVIQLSYPENHNSYYDKICDLTLKNKGVVLELPNCFGIRQKTDFGFAKIIKEAIQYAYEPGFFDPVIKVSARPGPWAYAEDIASFIWFIMEQDFFGAKGKIMRIPYTGVFSTEDILKVAKEELHKEITHTCTEPWKNFIQDYEKERVPEWKPDTYDFNWTLRKTISWYNVNKWIF
jgi:hypothetical protein